MFSFFHRAKAPKETVSVDKAPQQQETDTALIAVISAAIARFRETDGTGRSDAGFVVRRVRRI